MYLRYKAFIAELGNERGNTYAGRSFEDFRVWWASLDAEFRNLCAEDFRKAYEHLIEIAEARLNAKAAR